MNKKILSLIKNNKFDFNELIDNAIKKKYKLHFLSILLIGKILEKCIIGIIYSKINESFMFNMYEKKPLGGLKIRTLKNSYVLSLHN